MKKLLPFLSLAVLMAACSPNPKESTAPDAAAVTPATSIDTAGLAQFQQWKAQHELAETQQYQEPAIQYSQEAPVHKATVSHSVRKAPVHRAPKAAPVRHIPAPVAQSPAPSVSNGDGGTASSESAQTAKAEEKKGWSKAAKGAVIGGVGGAVTGAVINKKNRAMGAVLGGIVGAGGGYVIGRQMDKKDGRIELQ